LLTASSEANAEIFEVWVSGLAGGAFGNGSTSRDFYSFAGGGAFGAEAGIKIIFIGAYVEYWRFIGGDAGANLVTFNLGGDGSIKLVGGLHLVIRAAGGFYLGSLDSTVREEGGTKIQSAEVQTRGIGFRGGVGLRYVFFKVFSVGVTPQFGYHYFFGGADDNILNTDENSSGWDMNVLGYLRVGFGF
ncbi:MAG: hypothetical protein V1754_07750, partial [Pseudomonadota bacterium]